MLACVRVDCQHLDASIYRLLAKLAPFNCVQLNNKLGFDGICNIVVWYAYEFSCWMFSSNIKHARRGLELGGWHAGN